LGKLTGKCPLGTPKKKKKWEDDIKVDLKNTGLEIMNLWVLLS
jgi:hypothetical protein